MIIFFLSKSNKNWLWNSLFWKIWFKIKCIVKNYSDKYFFHVFVVWSKNCSQLTWSDNSSLPINFKCYLLQIRINSVGSSWSWSYGSWIYHYLCNQCLTKDFTFYKHLKSLNHRFLSITFKTFTLG